MRLLFLSCVAMAVTACAPPCTSSTSTLPASAGNFACSAHDAGARVRYRPYNTLDENFAEACTGALDGGALELTVTVRTCVAGASTGDGARECTLPTLSPGRYAVGDGALIVAADGGLTSCE